MKNTSHIQEEFSLTNDVHDLRTEIKSKNSTNSSDSLIAGVIEIQEQSENQVYIIGSIGGLEKGSAHGLHVIKYNDFLLNRNSEIELLHLNPSMSKVHDCPTIDKKNSRYHEGDIGNIIANDKGVASFSIQKNISIRAFIGRMIVVLKTKDVCDPGNFSDEGKQVLALGSLTVFKPDDVLVKDVKYYNDYIIREINTFSKSDGMEGKAPRHVEADESLSDYDPDANTAITENNDAIKGIKV
eukprot:CAMPEP_0170522656 /NCGR_PEP_ID=MMETSP0209-20121228/8086_1 /TAXON_ID=665100 ORGANISM="Litonotus pictus, Strain P1" /NCGR_SAMPLE_ID=MMETSP0209 /ASSEMBLY_ACC=CAM_ASM_000301 /LENGTH=240 /DNA_ID=CAMNT_0010810287 /DNA_START=55 /DNA_END=778 /DNA_ORIENTATION=-